MSFTKLKNKKTLITSILLVFILLMSFSPILSGGTGGVKKAEAQGVSTTIDGKTYQLAPGGGKATTTTGNTTTTTTLAGTTTQTVDKSSAISNEISGLSCIIAIANPKGCFLWIINALFNTFPQFLMGITAYMLNSIVSITLSSGVYFNGDGFVKSGWTLIRDISNLLFIFILLYIAIRTILGIGESENKKMIGTLIIVALLINFSMFFTKVVIDVSNQLALVFYNKIGTPASQEKSYTPITDPKKSGIEERDLSGVLAQGFKVSQMVSSELFDKAKKIQQVSVSNTLKDNLPLMLAGPIIYVGGVVHDFVVGEKVPDSVLLAIILISGVIATLAAYCFFIVALAFLSRLVMLWILIIFAPLAFLTSIIPAASKIEGIGWSKWWHDLISHAFMAPVFLFFLWLIYKLIESDPISALANNPNFTSNTLWDTLILILIPGIIIAILLLKATSYAKKASGELGGAIIKGASFLGGAVLGTAAGIGLGAISGGGSLLLRKTLGARGRKIAADDELKKRSTQGGIKGLLAKGQLGYGRFLAGSTFDARNTGAAKGLGKGLGKITGAAGLGSDVFTASKFEGLNKDLAKTGYAHGFSSEGGAQGAAERQKEYIVKEMESSKMTGASADSRNEDEHNWREKRDQEWVDIQKAAKEQGIELSAAIKHSFEEAYNAGADFNVTGTKDGEDVQVKKMGEDGKATDEDWHVQGVTKAWDADRENKQRALDFASAKELGGQYLKDEDRARKAQEALKTQYHKAVLNGIIKTEDEVEAPSDFNASEHRRIYTNDPEYAKTMTDSRVKNYIANEEVLKDGRDGNIEEIKKLKYSEEILSKKFQESYTSGEAEVFAKDNKHNWAAKEKTEPEKFNNDTGEVDSKKKKDHKNNFVAKEGEAMENDAKAGVRFDPKKFQKAFIGGGTYVTVDSKGVETETKMNGTKHPSQRKNLSKGAEQAVSEIRKSTGKEGDKAPPSPVEKFALDRDIRNLTSKLKDWSKNLMNLTTKLDENYIDPVYGKGVDGVKSGVEPNIELQQKILLELKRRNHIDKTNKDVAQLVLANSSSSTTEKAKAEKSYRTATDNLHTREAEAVMMQKLIDDKTKVMEDVAEKQKRRSS